MCERETHECEERGDGSGKEGGLAVLGGRKGRTLTNKHTHTPCRISCSGWEEEVSLTQAEADWLTGLQSELNNQSGDSSIKH